MQEFVWMDVGEEGGWRVQRERERGREVTGVAERGAKLFFHGSCVNKEDNHKAKCPWCEQQRDHLPLKLPVQFTSV